MTDNSLPRRESPGQQQPHIYRPIPRRTFSPQIPHDQGDSPTYALAQQPHSPTTSSLQSSRSSDFLAQLNARLLRTYNARTDDASPESPVEGALGSARGLPRQNKSFLNMNSSTLFGIYDDVGASTHGAASVAETPWGTGAETPGHTAMGWSGTVYDAAGGADAGGLSMKKSVRRGSTAKGRAVGVGEKRGGSQTRRARGATARYAVLVAKLAALFTFGVLYGTIVSHLHDTRHLAAVHIKGLDRENGFYITVWGCAGVALGSLLPYVDLVWSRHSALTDSDTEESESPEDGKDAESPISEQINDVVRSVAAFLGVAFAIRRLPWQSTLQLTLTLALVNPALWYILDRSKPGLTASLLVTSLLTTLLFLSNPTALPSPYDASPSFAAKNTTNSGSPASAAQRSHLLFAGLISYENLAVVTWVGSVLFCSCVCFGSIGRRLGLVGKK